MQWFKHRPEKVLFSGMSGMGKTTLWEKMVRENKARTKFVYDHEGEFSIRFDQPSVDSEQGLIEATARGGWVIYDPVEMFPGCAEEGLNFFADYVFIVSKHLEGKKLFCCDELQKLTDPNIKPKELVALLQTGRRLKVDFYGITQGPNEIHNRLRTQITRVYTFHLDEKNAIQPLAERGFDGDAVRALRPGEYLWRDFYSGESGSGGTAFQAHK